MHAADQRKKLAARPDRVHKHRAIGASRASRAAWTLMVQIFQAERGQFFRAWADRQLSGAQALLLIRLVPERPVPMKELAESLFCDASNITSLVDKLESKGLITRRPGQKDRRVKLIVVTKAGAKLRSELINRMFEPPPSFDCLSEREKTTLRDLLQKVAGPQPSAIPR